MDIKRVTEFDARRHFDAAMVEALTVELEGEDFFPVLTTFQRAFGRAGSLLRLMSHPRRVPLPSAFVKRTGEKDNLKRSFRGRRMRINFRDKSKTYAGYSKPPQGLDITYGYSAILKDPTQANALKDALDEKFAKTVHVERAFIPEFFFSSGLSIVIRKAAWADDYRVDDGDRLFEVRTDFVLEGYKFFPVEVVRTMGKVRTEFSEIRGEA